MHNNLGIKTKGYMGDTVCSQYPLHETNMSSNFKWQLYPLLH